MVQFLVCDPDCDELHHYLYSEFGSLDGEVKIPDDLSYLGSVSPDGLQMAYMTFHQSETGVRTGFHLIDLNTFIVTPLEFNLPEGGSVANIMRLR